MNSRSNQGPRQARYTVRHQARLDAPTLAKLEDLTSTCHRKRSAILRVVMQWGLHHSGGWTIDRSPIGSVPPVPVLVEPDLLQQVQAAAKEATAYTQRSVEGKRVRLEYDQQRRDKYGRTLAYVYLDDGTFVNAEIIKQGYGFAYIRFPFKYLEHFRALEREVREAKRGLWGP